MFRNFSKYTFIVFMALFLDNILLTSIVAVIPTILVRIDEDKARLNYSKFNISQWQIDQLIQNESVLRIQRQNALAGIVFCSKALVQILMNPLAGYIVAWFDSQIPLLMGTVIMGFSSLLFAFSQTPYGFLCARAIQGFGSSCSSVAGLTMLANKFLNDEERGTQMGVALGGLAFGVLVGPPFGGFFAQYVGESSPFLVLTLIAILNGFIQLIFIDNYEISCNQSFFANKNPSIFQLLRDPFIAISFAAIAFGNVGIAMLEPSLPMWLYRQLHASEFKQGSAFVAASLTYLICTFLFGKLAYRMQRWKCCFWGLAIGGFSLILIPFTTTLWLLAIPVGALGVSMGMVDSSITPLFGRIIDMRWQCSYCNVYAITDTAFCLGYVLGPSLGGLLVSKFGFTLAVNVIGFFVLLFAPFVIYLKNIEPMEPCN